MRLSILAAFAALFVFGCGKSDPAPDNKGGPGPTPAPGPTPTPDGDKKPADPPTVKADVTITADEWAKEFKADKKAAQAKYKGKVIEMTGEVASLQLALGDMAVYLKVKGEAGVPGVPSGEMCVMTDLNCWESISPGSGVTIRGKSSTVFSEGRVVEGCSIVKADQNPAKTMTAEDFAKKYKADPKKSRQAWDDLGLKWVYLEGVLASDVAGNDVLGVREFALKGEGETLISCSDLKRVSGEKGGMKSGQKVKILGLLSEYRGAKGEPVIKEGLYKLR